MIVGVLGNLCSMHGCSEEEEFGVVGERSRDDLHHAIDEY